MEATNPYQAPTADLNQTPDLDLTDKTPVFSPKGRFSRLSYLGWGLVLMIISWLLMFAVTIATVGIVGEEFLTTGITGPFVGLFFFVIGIGMLVAWAIFTTRRLHDMNMSAWWLLLMLLPVVNVIFALVLTVVPGFEKANRFGPPRETPTWEKVFGWLMVVLLVLMTIGSIANGLFLQFTL